MAFLGEPWPHDKPVQTTAPNRTGLDDRTPRSEDIILETGVPAPLPVDLGQRGNPVLPEYVGPKRETDVFGLPLYP